MQPQCSLPLGPCGPAASLGPQGSAAGLQRLEGKQLFEKFWRGTFKAVATPRPESVIVASITARTRVANFQATACQALKTDERGAADARAEPAGSSVCIKGKARKHHGHRRARSPSFDQELSPRPKAKKKKRKSERKRKRKRSPSYSLSPLRKKKKKKKKKSSKKSKRHRYTSKKSKHSSSSLKHKRRDKRKHKKSSRTHSRRSRRYRRSESYSSSCHSSAEYRKQRSVAAAREEANGVDRKWRPAARAACTAAPGDRSVLSTCTTLSSKPGSELLQGKGSQPLPSRVAGPRDYDSGNDTSSPPSSKTDVSRPSAAGNKRSRCRRPASPEKLKLTDRDNASDSGNSVTSYTSLCKHEREDGLCAGRREQITLGCQVEAETPQKTSRCSRKMSPSSRKRRRTSSSRSRSRSTGSSRYSGRYSRSLSLSSCSSYSRSPSSSADLRRRGSVASLSSRGSYSRRLRDRKRAPSHRETDVKTARRKVSGKRRRRKSYSPMKKRRRDSPSHLEARRITSARKRPIPYFRPSPSSSSRSTSVSSWSSLFTRSRSRSPLRSVSRSRSRSRSRSYSSYRSYSRSSSFNSVFGSRSRSRSCGPLKKRNRTRR